MVKMLRPYQNVQTYHFCHEKYSFASTPYDLQCYDRNVNFPRRVQEISVHYYYKNYILVIDLTLL